MVVCPFPHHTASGVAYYESNPSAGVNLEKGVYHCLSCGKAHSEVGFIAEILSTSYETATKIKELFDRDENVHLWKEYSQLTKDIKIKINNLGISDKVIEDLNIGTEDGVSISFPVTMYDTVLDVRNYRPNERPKMKSRPKATAGLIIPYDLWRTTPANRWTIFCAGEKDMAVARSHGLNAITITGGEMATPIVLSAFKDRKVAIVYDNDDAGIRGSKLLAAALKPYTKELKVVTKFHEVCKEKGEDITDFFMKYKGTKDQLVQYITDTPLFTDEDADKEIEQSIPTVTLLEATKPQNINKTLRSNIQVVALNESIYPTPTAFYFEKKTIDSTKKNHTMEVGEKRYWYLRDNTAKDILHLLDNKLKEEVVYANMKRLVGVPDDETGVHRHLLSKESVFRCSVTDLFELSNDETIPLEFAAYVVGKKLENGKKYRATYRIVPHPYDGQRLTMIILNVSEATDSVTNFKLTDTVKSQLKVIQNIPGSVKEKVDFLANKVRGLTHFNTELTLIKAIDLSFNTALEFNFRSFKKVRAYLETIIVAESRIGKSTVAEALQDTYGLGVITSLAGSSATVPGIIGGSNKTAGGAYQVRAGLIPQNHKGLIVFEELAKCNSMILKEMTDIRSSGRARITRVGGSLDLPALVRMISLTNTRAPIGGGSRPITSYPNGMEILTDIVGTPEDIARYDMMLIQANRGTSMEEEWVEPTPLPKEVYRARIRWIWSRKPEQLIISHDVETYIIRVCNELNKTYDTHIKIFGTEAWKKISRLALAVAGYTVSTDESYENIIVTQEHVDYARDFYVAIYDNDTFRLKEYVEEERRYEVVDDNGINLLQQMFISSAGLLLQLEGRSACSRPELQAATGLTQDQFNGQLNLLITGAFVRFQGQSIVPTLRFRRTMAKIDRRTTLVQLGGVSHDIKQVDKE